MTIPEDAQLSIRVIMATPIDPSKMESREYAGNPALGFSPSVEIFLPAEYGYAGVNIARYTAHGDVWLNFSGWRGFDSAGREPQGVGIYPLTLKMFLEALGLTAEDCQKALKS